MTNKKFKEGNFSFTVLPQKRQDELLAQATQQLTEKALTRMACDTDAMVLFYFMRVKGYGKHRLREIYDGVFESRRDLREAWEGDDREVVEDAKRELRKIGVDIDLWNAQKREWLDGGYKNDKVWNSYGPKEL